SDFASKNTIGGTGVTAGSCDGPCNIIANNGSTTTQSARAGIYIDPTAGVGNAIRANSIFSNGSATVCGSSSGPSQGIDLGTPCATGNDAGDGDTGPNDLQNKPVITAANTAKFVSGTLNSTASTTFVIDFY